MSVITKSLVLVPAVVHLDRHLPQLMMLIRLFLLLRLLLLLLQPLLPSAARLLRRALVDLLGAVAVGEVVDGELLARRERPRYMHMHVTAKCKCSARFPL